MNRIRPSRDSMGGSAATPYCGRYCDLDAGHRGPHRTWSDPHVVPDGVAAALIQTGMYVDAVEAGLDSPRNYADALLDALAERGLSVVSIESHKETE